MVVVLASLFVNVRLYQTLHHLKPLIVRIDDVGRAEAVTYDSFNYQPREAEIDTS